MDEVDLLKRHEGPPYVDEHTGKVLDTAEVLAGMKAELESIQSYQCLYPASPGDEKTARIIGTRWVLCLKPTRENPNRVKARLVVQDVNYGWPEDTFAATPS